MTATSKKRTKKPISKKASKKVVKKRIVRKKAVKKPSTAKKTAAKKTKRVKKTTARKAKSAKKAAVRKAKTTKKLVKKTSKKQVSRKKSAKKSAPVKAKKKAKPVRAKRVKKKTIRKKTKTTAAARPTRKKSAKDDEMIHGIAPYRASRGEEYMNPQQIEHFREILSAWRRELVGEINRTIHSMQDETVNHPDPNDRATQETDMSLELRSRDRERKLIKKIDDTVALIDAGDYGYCVKCGVEVGVARLEARPTANLCIDCKTLDEIREKQMI